MIKINDNKNIMEEKSGNKADARFKPGGGGNVLPGPGPGRPKGSKNSVSKEMVEDVFAAYQKLGGAKYLLKLAKEKHVVTVPPSGYIPENHCCIILCSTGR